VTAATPDDAERLVGRARLLLDSGWVEKGRAAGLIDDLWAQALPLISASMRARGYERSAEEDLISLPWQLREAETSRWRDPSAQGIAERVAPEGAGGAAAAAVRGEQRGGAVRVGAELDRRARVRPGAAVQDRGQHPVPYAMYVRNAVSRWLQHRS
jgi:hypothetical protein